jgi:hypothetical protein
LLPEEEECPHDKYFEVIVLINDDPFSKKKFTDKFADFFAEREPTGVTLRETSCGFCRWTVEVLFDGEAKMYLHTG